MSAVSALFNSDSPPPPQTPPPASTPSDPATSAKMSAAEKEQDDESARGQASTMLTGGMGLSSMGSTSRSILTGK